MDAHLKYAHQTFYWFKITEKTTPDKCYESEPRQSCLDSKPSFEHVMIIELPSTIRMIRMAQLCGGIVSMDLYIWQAFYVSLIGRPRQWFPLPQAINKE